MLKKFLPSENQNTFFKIASILDKSSASDMCLYFSQNNKSVAMPPLRKLAKESASVT